MWMEFTADICCCLVFFWFGLVWFGLVQLAVPGCSWGGQFPNVLPRWLFVILHNLFYDIMWSEYIVNKMKVELCLSSEKQFLQNKVKQLSCQTKWNPSQNA
jgi:TM2 domain-containing membrane protein YozV